MNAPVRRTRRRWLAILLAAVVAGELAGIVYLWPVIAAKWRASPHRLHPNSPASRPAGWAQPLAAAGLKNLHQVSPDLYRGARPTAEGIRQLKAMDVRTVVDLEVFHSDRDAASEAGLDYVPISFEPGYPET
jgi:hypothetical protein